MTGVIQVELHPGQIVYSKAGRDKGKYFIVIKRIDDNYVYISDGDLRRIDRPKKKKIKHLLVTENKAEYIVQKLERSQKITNSDIRKCLSTFKDEMERAKLESFGRG